MKICIIGGTGHYSYALSALAAGEPDAELTGIAPGSAGENVDGVLAAAGKIGLHPICFTGHPEMLDRLHPDIAVVAPYFGDNAKISAECLERGIHVFIDKPVATTFEDLASLRQVYDRSHAASGVSLAAMFGIRYSAPFLTAYAAVRDGAVGQIRLMHAQKSYKLGQRGENYKKRATYGGTIPWVGEHAIDWFHWFSGAKFASVYATHSKIANQDNGELESTASCLYEMSDGVSATLSIDYLRPESAPTHGDDRMRIVGTKGVIGIRNDAVYLLDSVTNEIQTPMLLPARDIFTDFISQVRGQSKCMVTADESFYITEVALISRQSADEKKVISF